jgi:hypothetical protein
MYVLFFSGIAASIGCRGALLGLRDLCVALLLHFSRSFRGAHVSVIPAFLCVGFCLGIGVAASVFLKIGAALGLSGGKICLIDFVLCRSTFFISENAFLKKVFIPIRLSSVSFPCLFTLLL